MNFQENRKKNRIQTYLFSFSIYHFFILWQIYEVY